MKPALAGVGHQFFQRRRTEIGAIVIGLDLKDRELNGKFYGDGVDTEKQYDGRLQLLPQSRNGDRCPGVVDNGDIADVHLACFQYPGEEGQLVIRQKGGVGRWYEDRDLAAIVAQESIGGG